MKLLRSALLTQFVGALGLALVAVVLLRGGWREESALAVLAVLAWGLAVAHQRAAAQPRASGRSPDAAASAATDATGETRAKRAGA